MALSYEIVSVQKARPAPSFEGSNWHSYVISFKGAKSIEGFRQGSLETVTSALEEIVARLNERHLGRYSKPGRAHTAPTAKKVSK